MEKKIKARIKISVSNDIFCSPLCRFYTVGYCRLFNEDLPYVKVDKYEVDVRCLQCIKGELETKEGKENKRLKEFYEKMKKRGAE